jgi:hypothetical protein
MSTTSVIGDAQQQVVDVSRSVVRLSWAMTVLGAQQAANMMLPSKIAKSGSNLAAALDAMTGAIERQFGDNLKSAYRAGSVFAMAPLDGLPSFEVNRAMQGLAMQPVFFEPLKVMMPPLAASMAAFIPGHDAGLVRRECEAKMEVMQLVQDVRKICPDENVYVPLPEVVARGYALGSFPALWAVEGIGHDLVTSRHHRGEPLNALLTSKDVGKLPEASLTMLHAGIGLGLAELALKDLRPDSAPEKIDAAIERFLAECRSSSRNGYLGCALESLGLVTRHFYGHEMVLAVDKRLDKEAALRGFFWHGVGRAVYFSPENMVPGFSSPWPAVAMCERLAPHDVARDNLVAGVAWGMTMVNLKQPAVLEGFLKKHGQGFGDRDAFINGVQSSMIMRKNTTPDEPHIAAMLAYEPATSDARLQSLWDRVVRQSVSKALNEYYPAIVAKKQLGEVFRFQSLGELGR